MGWGGVGVESNWVGLGGAVGREIRTEGVGHEGLSGCSEEGEDRGFVFKGSAERGNPFLLP